MTFRQKLILYARLVRLDRPIGILLLLWPTLWGLWLAADGLPDLNVLFIFVLGTILMRSAGCAINDFADRRIDPHVARTRNRPLASGAIQPKEALLVAAGLSLCAFVLILPLNQLTILLSIPALLLAASYPFTKRFFAMPQAYLGIAFSFGIPMAFAAQTNSLPFIIWPLLFANLCWVIAYDTEYAMVDREDDLKIGVKTSAITLGRFDVAGIMLCYVAFLSLLVYVGLEAQRGIWFYAALLMASGLVLHQYQLIRDRDPSNCFRAFLDNNVVGATVFIGIALDTAFA
ncbi:4-hydroxybenzoate octaprenyltransferase [Nitrosomonas mobilis]|uniref:4-hydroxybenzoate octaprenyltransferase n=1 Tax=Nitrosomonas mobilis TaxID=51642 RepID=A0A1G5SC36_9PROT|nr:4-hydroxybenzoate octaprenyltransferase [Nitrosomonas mobilis]SCZ84736.1 4-hydroxybenzoate octaprenyltransferase [Nitrosomonas mobilis]